MKIVDNKLIDTDNHIADLQSDMKRRATVFQCDMLEKTMEGLSTKKAERAILDKIETLLPRD